MEPISWYNLASSFPVFFFFPPLIGVCLALFTVLDAFTLKNGSFGMTRFFGAVSACVNTTLLMLLVIPCCVLSCTWLLAVPGTAIALTLLAAWRMDALSVKNLR